MNVSDVFDVDHGKPAAWEAGLVEVSVYGRDAVDFTALDSALTTAKADLGATSTYTADSLADLQKATDAATAVRSDQQATQAQADVAAANLNAAIAALDPIANAVNLKVSVTGTCVANKAALKVQADNGGNVPTDITVNALGATAKFSAVKSGKSVKQTFNATTKSVPAGTVTVTGFTSVDGKVDNHTYSVNYAAVTCK